MQLFTEEQQASLEPLQRCLNLWMSSMDGERHLSIRRRVSKGFTPRTIENMRPQVQTRSDLLIDEMIEQAGPEGNIELMEQFAHPLPAAAIAQFLGANFEDQMKFVEWSDQLGKFIGSASPTYEDALLAQHGVLSMTNYFANIVAERRVNPSDDLISQLLKADSPEDMLTPDELFSQCVVFLVGGHETTRNMIANGIQTLLQHPDQAELLRHNPALIKSAVEEIVRYEAPAQLIARIALEDFEFQGAQIKAGQAVVSVIGAANRDPEQYSDPDRFDITRTDNRPLSFGYGPHICIGMALSYLETEIAIGTLIQRLPNLRLVEPTPDWTPSVFFRSLQKLPLRFDPQAQ
jgi:cytochrome P450